ncbi:MAG TPA: hypothetical protein VKZ59_09185, partial [Acidobacteriota bacterium]|nr:hypothetical protein [Acidobacteriota bacterium]
GESASGKLVAVDDTFVTELFLTVSRNKWEADEIELSPGDPVVVGLKDYRLRPYLPLAHDL